MKSKLFLAAFINLVWVSFPQNIIGCGPGIDPYDYFTSFISNQLPEPKTYQPFYYTGYNFLYSEQEPVNTSELLAEEWAAYCGKPVTAKAAHHFVNQFSYADFKKLYEHIEKKKTLPLAASLKNNAMSQYFSSSKDLEALGYLMYAKQVEPYVLGSSNYWEAITRDSIKMDRLIKNGRQLYQAAKKDFIRLRYAYQIIRLAHYSQNYTMAIKDYNQMINPQTPGVLQPMSLALKAGALFRTGQQMEAAYLFSKAFSASPVKRVSNYISFDWAVNSEKSREEYLALCANNKEKADMLALFALSSPVWELESMQKIYAWAPDADVLQVLAIREINKMEEQYLTPQLQNKDGGKTFFYNWNEGKSDSIIRANALQAAALQQFFTKLGADNTVPNAGLYQIGAAYTALMQKDFTAARNLLDKAKTMQLSNKLKDQWQLSNLLLQINATEKIDDSFEAGILPSLQWLAQKALTDKTEGDGWRTPPSEWKTFYRNLMGEVMAKRYRQQGDRYKEALAVGTAEYIMNGGRKTEYGSQSADFLHNQSGSRDVELLFAYLNAKNKTGFAQFISTNNALKLSEVIDFAGTAYLRDNNYAKAIEWFSKSPATASRQIQKNPFIELLYDQEERLPTDKITSTKLAFAKEMQRLQGLVKSDKANAAKHLYKMALGYYNTTYYGYAWELVEYYRSGVDGYHIPKDATEFQKNYYGCNMAHDYFKMAMEASGNKEFKAKCLFMMAKCAQKQIRKPQYEDFSYNWDAYDAAEKTYFPLFKNNHYFPQLKKEYGNTLFYKEAYNSCSYLRDFQF